MKNMAKLTITLAILATSSLSFTQEAGLITILASLSSTALTAARTLMENVLADSSDVEKLREFVEENESQLAADISRSEGDTITAVSDILDVDTSRRSNFAAKLQENFDLIYPSTETDSMYVAETIAEIAEISTL